MKECPAGGRLCLFVQTVGVWGVRPPTELCGSSTVSPNLQGDHLWGKIKHGVSFLNSQGEVVRKG